MWIWSLNSWPFLAPSSHYHLICPSNANISSVVCYSSLDSYQDMTSMIWVRLACMLEQDIFVIFLQNQTKIRLRRSAPPKCASLKRYPKCLHDCSPNLIFRKTMRCGTGHFDQRLVLIGFQAYFFVRVVSVSSRDNQQQKVQHYRYFIHTFQKTLSLRVNA